MRLLQAGAKSRGGFTRGFLNDCLIAASGTVTAMIAEFPGCVAEGNSVEEAYAKLQDAAESWIEAAMDSGHDIPSPAADESYSGRVLLRLPRSVHRRAADAAARDGTSLNQFVLAAVAEKLGADRQGGHEARRAV